MQDSYHIKRDGKAIAVMAFLLPDVHSDGNKRWMISNISVARGTPRGEGWGTRLLTLICDQADAESVELILGVDNYDSPRYFNRLVAWYKRHGFTPYKHSRVTRVHNLMLRKPKKQES